MYLEYYEAVHEIITTGHRIIDDVTRVLKKHDMSEPQFNVLRILKHSGNKPVSVGGILENMVQRSSNITRIVDKLVTKKYVIRMECPTNRTKMDIAITPLGSSILTKLEKSVHAYHKPNYNKLNKQELISLKNLIQKLKTN